MMSLDRYTQELERQQEIIRLQNLIAPLFCNCLLAYDECRKCKLQYRLDKLIEEKEKGDVVS